MLPPMRSMLTSSQIAQLNARSLRVVGDLVRVVDDELRWIEGAGLDLPWLDEFTAGLDLPADPIAGRYGQCWLANSKSGAIPPGTIVEFLGRGDGDNCAVKSGKEYCRTLAKSARSALLKANPCPGAQGATW